LANYEPKKAAEFAETCQACPFPHNATVGQAMYRFRKCFPFPFLLLIFHSCAFTWTVNHLFVVRITNGGQVRTQACRMKKSLLKPLRLQAHDMNTKCLRYALDASAERATLG